MQPVHHGAPGTGIVVAVLGRVADDRVRPVADILGAGYIDQVDSEARPAAAEDYESVERLWLELNAHHVEVEPELIQPVDEYLSRESYNAVVCDPKQEILILCEGTDVVGAVWLVQRMHEGLCTARDVQASRLTVPGRSQGANRPVPNDRLSSWSGGMQRRDKGLQPARSHHSGASS